jgi:hypothetical protein
VQQHECKNKWLALWLILIPQNLLFSIFKCTHTYLINSYLAILKQSKILGCYNSTPLKRISSSRFGRRWTKRYTYSAFGSFPLSWVVWFSNLPFHAALPVVTTLLQITYSSISKTLTEYLV